MGEYLIQVDGYEFTIVFGLWSRADGIVINPDIELDARYLKAIKQAQDLYKYYWAYHMLLTSSGARYIDDLKHISTADVIEAAMPYIKNLQEAFSKGLLLEYQTVFENWYKRFTDAVAEKASREIVIKSKRTADLQGYVYLIKIENTNHYKIGRSKNPNSRIKGFQVKMPFEFEIICLIQADDMFCLESELHTMFANQHVNGEWFQLNESDVEYIKGLSNE